jgi:hypothetical protein
LESQGVGFWDFSSISLSLLIRKKFHAFNTQCPTTSSWVTTYFMLALFTSPDKKLKRLY